MVILIGTFLFVAPLTAGIWSSIKGIERIRTRR